MSKEDIWDRAYRMATRTTLGQVSEILKNSPTLQEALKKIEELADVEQNRP